MKLPYADRAVVPPEKITAYLLSPTHPIGRSKAAFYASLGYDISDPNRLAADLIALAGDSEVVETELIRFGTKYILEGPLSIPVGGIRIIRSVWIIRNGEDYPVLVTAYPA
jgi:hypothetical protein